MTMVDPVTGWPEFTQLQGDLTAYRCQESLNNVWLLYYLRPKEIRCNNGSKFKKEFSCLYANMRLKKKKSDDWNPQSNTILERIHQVLEEVLQVFDLDNKEIDPNDNNPFQEYLIAVAYVIHSAYH